MSEERKEGMVKLTMGNLREAVIAGRCGYEMPDEKLRLWAESLVSALSAPTPVVPREGVAMQERMIAPLIETLYRLGYPPIAHRHAREALTAALSGSAARGREGEG